MIDFFYRRYYDRHLFIIEYENNKNENGAFSAVKALINTLVSMLIDEECNDRGKLLRNEVNDNYIALEYSPYSFSEQYAEGITDTILSGIYSLEEEYPETLKVS